MGIDDLIMCWFLWRVVENINKDKSSLLEQIWLTAREHIKSRKSVWYTAICGSSAALISQDSRHQTENLGDTETQKSGLDLLKSISNSWPIE